MTGLLTGSALLAGCGSSEPATLTTTPSSTTTTTAASTTSTSSPTVVGSTTPASSPSASRTARSPEATAAACATAVSRTVLTKDDAGRTVHVTGDARIDLRAAGTDNDADARTDSDAVELVRTVDAPGRQYDVRPDHPGTARITVPDPSGFTVTVVVCR